MADHQIWVSHGKGGKFRIPAAPRPHSGTIQAALNRSFDGADVMVKAGTYAGNLKFFDNDVSLISAMEIRKPPSSRASQNGSTMAVGFGLEECRHQGFEMTARTNSNAVRFGMSGSGFSDPVRNLTNTNNLIHELRRAASKSRRPTM